jgi:uroporphyrinogen decarboxylase
MQDELNKGSLSRVLKAINHEEPDRVPIDFGSRETTIHEEPYLELKKYLKIKGMDIDKEKDIQYKQFFLKSVEVDREVLDCLGSDIVNVEIGMEKVSNPKIKIDFINNIFINEWGTRYRSSKDGKFFNYFDFPLKTINKSAIDNYKWPDTSNRINKIRDIIKEEFNKKEKAVLLSGVTGIIAIHWFLRGLEQSYMDFAGQLKETCYLFDRILDWQMEMWDGILTQSGENIHIIEATNDDVASNEGLIISPETYRQVLKPRQSKLIDFIKKRTGAKIFSHSCGAIYEIIPDLIEIGVDILNPIQVTAKGMESSRLKKDFGKSITFCGGGCSNSVLQNGSIQEVKEEVKRRLDDFMPGGGYIFAPIHNIQPGVPSENIATLFESAREYGSYSG